MVLCLFASFFMIHVVLHWCLCIRADTSSSLYRLVLKDLSLLGPWIIMGKWTLETSNWIRFSSSSSSWWAFIWLGCPLPGQTVRRAEPIFVSVLLFLLGISFSSHPGAILFPLWWCLCDWMTWYNSQLLCVSISSIIHLFGCLGYTLHVICPKLSFWLL